MGIPEAFNQPFTMYWMGLLQNFASRSEVEKNLVLDKSKLNPKPKAIPKSLQKNPSKDHFSRNRFI